jgi:hypothetical protein
MSSAVPKVAHDIMLSTGFMTYFSVGDMASITKSGIDVAGTGMSGAWNKDENYGREMGEAMGGVVGAFAMGGANLMFMGHNASVYGGQKTWMGGDWGTKAGHGDSWLGKQMNKVNSPADTVEAKIAKNGKVYAAMEDGGYKHSGNYKGGKFTPFEGEAVAAETRLGKALAGGGKSGYIRTSGNASKFIKGQSAIRGFAPFALAMGAGVLARGVLGFAGGLLDESAKDYHRERAIHYDNRFFNTQREEQSNMQTLGMAMNNYENRFQSTARIYHAR